MAIPGSLRTAAIPTGLFVGRILIAGISLYDALLLVMFSDSIRNYEENPFGRLLLSVSNGDVTLFVVTKILGTAFVFWTLRHIEKRNQEMATTITSSVLIFQFWLLWYLCCSVNQRPFREQLIHAAFATIFALSILQPYASGLVRRFSPS